MYQDLCFAHNLPTVKGTSFCSFECQVQEHLQAQDGATPEESMELVDIFEYNEDETGCNYNYTRSNVDVSSLLGSELVTTLETEHEYLDDSTFTGILYDCVWCNEKHLLSTPCKAIHQQQQQLTSTYLNESILSRNNELIQTNYQKWLNLSVN